MYGRRHIDIRCYTLLDKDFKIIRMGQLQFPKRGIHLCVGMNQGETYIFAHSGNVEDNQEWHQFKYELTGDAWDYVERQAMVMYSPDITKEEFWSGRVFHDRSDTCGWVENLDCCFTENGDLLLLFCEETIHQPLMQERFFPDVKPEGILWVYRFSHGELVEKTVVHREPETAEKKVCYSGFFHTAADGKIYAVWSMGTGKPFLNRVVVDVKVCQTYLSDVSDLTKEPIQLADTAGHVLFGNKTRLGAQPGDMLDLYYLEGDRMQNTERMMHAEYDLKELLGSEKGE